MTRCPDATDWVLYASGEMAADRRAECDAHLEACATCRDELAAVRRGVEAMQAAPSAPPLRAEALRTLRDRLADEARAGVRPSRRRHPVRWLTGAAAAAAAVVAAVLLSLPEETPEPTWTDVAQIDDEIAEIAAGLELLETDTFVTVLDRSNGASGESHESPAGQSRSEPAPAKTRRTGRSA